MINLINHHNFIKNKLISIFHWRDFQHAKSELFLRMLIAQVGFHRVFKLRLKGAVPAPVLVIFIAKFQVMI